MSVVGRYRASHESSANFSFQIESVTPLLTGSFSVEDLKGFINTTQSVPTLSWLGAHSRR
jgi:hypothetical protein